MTETKKKKLTKKAKEIELKAQIKAAEDKRRREVLKKAGPLQVEGLKLSFNSWYALRSKSFSKKHYKEIVWADFAARGLSKKETCTAYDDALGKYGVQLAK